MDTIDEKRFTLLNKCLVFENQPEMTMGDYDRYFKRFGDALDQPKLDTSIGDNNPEILAKYIGEFGKPIEKETGQFGCYIFKKQ